MFASQKRIFAGKPSVHYEPFCPYLTNDRGFRSLSLSQRIANRLAQKRAPQRRERRIYQ